MPLFRIIYSRIANSLLESDTAFPPRLTVRAVQSTVKSATVNTSLVLSDVRRIITRSLASSSSKANGFTR